MSATVAAALKKIAVAILTDKKLRKTFLGIVLGIIVIIVMPFAAIIALFNGGINIDTNRLQTLVVQNMSAEEQARLQRVEDLMYEIKDEMTDAGFDKQRVKEAQVLYVLALSDCSEEAGFVDKLVGCFAEGQSDAELIAAVNAAFGTDLSAEDFTKVMSAIRAVYISTAGYIDPSTKNNLDLVQWAKNAYSRGWGYVRLLRARGIGIFFEEQNIDTLKSDSELYLVIYAGFAQSESESISKNITWSYRKNFEDGKPIFMFKKLLGYKKGEDGEPVIVPEEAEIVERIYTMYLSGMTVDVISRQLQSEHIVIPDKKFSFGKNMVMNILKNEKYCGDCILQKTVTVDCISKTRKKNEGEAPMYIVENSHPAIISREMFNRAQEELSKRKARSPQSQKTAITASGKYSKYALTDVLICAECGSRYKRVTWTSLGQKRIVWRCVNRLDNGKKYCQHSPTLSEPALQEAIVRALNKFNDEDTSTYLTLMKATIGEAIGANGGSDEIDLLERRIDALNSRMLKMVSDSVERGADMEENEDEFKTISEQIEQLNRRIEAIRKSEGSDEDRQERLSLIQATIDQREAHRDTYDDAIVRQMIECVKIHEGGKLTIIFGGGYEIEEQI